MKHVLFVIAFLIAFPVTAATFPRTTDASEIHYATLKEQYGNTLLLEYKGPAGAQYFTCTVAGKCKKRGVTQPQLTPSILGSKTYEKSADGSRAVKTTMVGGKAYYFLYDTSGKKAKKIALIPYTTAGAKVYLAKNNNAVVFKNGTLFTRYDVAKKKSTSVTLTQDLSFLSISPNASYVTGYNYGSQKHELWKFADGKKYEGPSSMQSYVEFSEDESRFAFLEDDGGWKTLRAMETKDLGTAATPSLIQLTKGGSEVEDYLYAGNTLYFMQNKESPVSYGLHAHTGNNTPPTLVDAEVSYGDFLKRVRVDGTSYLAYLKTEGMNTNVILLSPETTKKTRLAGVKDAPLATNITREVTVYAKRTGVLLTPAKPASNPALFIWLHGGPQHQVALGYHPYLSYAVYDELLERLAAGGNYVYKLDYTGSTGYGAEFRKALDMNIGNVEMKDVKNVIAAIKKEKKVGNVYLIGNSYGGYMALRGIVEMPKELAGVISINGVSDWYGLIQQIPSSPFRELFNGVPDTVNLDAYMQASVFKGMEGLTKQDKVLVVWGEQDSTVPTWQSTKYIEYAKPQKATVTSLSFPEEDHILRKRANLDTLCERVTKDMGIKGVTCSL